MQGDIERENDAPISRFMDRTLPLQSAGYQVYVGEEVAFPAIAALAKFTPPSGNNADFFVQLLENVKANVATYEAHILSTTGARDRRVLKHNSGPSLSHSFKQTTRYSFNGVGSSNMIVASSRSPQADDGPDADKP